MTLSYSGLVNYGKVTLPSVEGWGTDMNIARDPPRSIMTRKIERVGDTSRITATLAESDDRFCENISYYAKGVNPMVAVSYGEAGRQNMSGGSIGDSGLSSSQAFLPYRVVREGAFRPPVWRQEDLMPLSRQPRNRFSCDARIEKTDFSKVACDCDLPAREIRDVLMTRCETGKTLSREPDRCEPSNIEIMLRDPLAPGTMDTNVSYVGFDDPRRLAREADTYHNMILRPARPTPFDVATNACGIASTSIADMVPTDLRLSLNRPIAEGRTSVCGRVEQEPMSSYVWLPPKPDRGAFACRPIVPSITTDGGDGRIVGKVRRV